MILGGFFVWEKSMYLRIMYTKTKHLFILCIISLMLFAFCVIQQHYQLSTPDKSYTLPPSLNEISGITILNNNEIACVQDELGIIYIYDLKDGKISKEYKTGLVGDYEGIAIVSNTIYLLRSDGVLVEYPDFRSPNLRIKEYALNLPSLNNEGLCYDMKNYRLLIAAKIKPGKDKLDKDIRHIYSFDLKTKAPNNVPIIKLSVDDIEAVAVKQNIPIPYRTNKKTGAKINAFNFRPSEIAVHPINGYIYILSANDKLLLMIDKNGTIQNLLQLAPILFNKAEGLAFLPDGTMLISNEAQQGKPTLLTFKYKN